MSEEYVAGYAASELPAEFGSDAEVDLQAAAESNQSNIFKDTASDLAGRKTQQDSYDEDSYSPQRMEAELKLGEIQKQMFIMSQQGINDPLKMMSMEAQANQLAAYLTGAPKQTQEQFNQQFDQEDTESIAEHLRQEYGNADEILANAAEALPESIAQEFNSMLSSGDEAATRATMETLKHLNESPALFDTTGSAGVMSQASYNEGVEAYGKEIMDDLMLTSQMVASGQINGAQALKTLTGKGTTKHLTSLMDGAKRGLWQINMGGK